MNLFNLLEVDKKKIIKEININSIKCNTAEFMLANIISGFNDKFVPPEEWKVKKIYLTKDGQGIGVEVE